MVRLFVSIIAIQYVAWSLALHYLARYLCRRERYVALIPIMNLVYFGYLTDIVRKEAEQQERTFGAIITGIFAVILGVSVVAKNFMFYDYAQVACNIGIWNGACGLGVSLVYYHACMLDMAFEDRPWVVWLFLVFVPYPVTLWVSSYRVRNYIEESIELFSGQ